MAAQSSSRPRCVLTAASLPRLLTLVLVLSGLWAMSGCDSSGGAPPPIEPGNRLLDEAVAVRIEELLADIRSAPRDGAARGRLGMAYDINGLDDKALECYAQAIALDPTEGRWYYHSAILFTEDGQFEAALAMFDSTSMYAPDYRPTVWRRAQLLFSQGEFDRAEEAFREAKRRQPKHPAGVLGLARIHLQRGENEKAAALLEQTLATGTRGAFVPYVHYLLGRAYRQLGRIDDARRELSEGRRGRPLWMDSWRMELDEYNVGLLGKLAATGRLMSTGRNAEAIPQLEEMRQDYPDDRNLLDQLTRAYFNVGRVRDALKTLQASVAVRPDDDRGYRNLSQIHLTLGDLPEALRCAKLCVELNPKIADGHANYGEILAKVGRKEDALAAYRAGLEQDPSDEAALLGAAQMSAELGLWDESHRHFDRVLRDNPEHEVALRGRARAAEHLE